MSTYSKMTPATADEYSIFPAAAGLEPQVSSPGAQAPRTIRRSRAPEFYKPFHYILLAYLFFFCSHISELASFLHIGLLLQPILLIGMIMTGYTKTIFRTEIGRIMTAFVVWVAICVPFSVWRGGSFTTFVTSLQALALLFFMAAFIRNIDDCFRVMVTIALAMAAVGVLSMVIGGGKMHDSRLGLGTGSDTLADANFLALHLVVGLPFLWFSASLKKGFQKIALICMMVPVLAGAARTGSRMGLLALGVGLVFYFIFAPAKQRAVIIMGGTVFLICAVMFLPQRITERFTTFFEPHSAAAAEAAQSAESRKALFLRSLQLSMEHPLFGVGPGEFIDGEAKEAIAQGKKGMWHYTHNSYTELSSETGLIGFGLFVFAMYRAYKGLTPIRNKYPRSIVRKGAMYLQIAVLIAFVGAFFLSIAYTGLLYAILGLSATYQLAVAKEMRMMKEQAREAIP